MEGIRENGLLLATEESVTYRYDFSTLTQAEGVNSCGYEDSLIFTDRRVIRRGMKGNGFSQKEILIDDINQINCSCETKSFQVLASRKKIVPIFIAFLLFFIVMFIVSLIEERSVLAVVSGVLFLITLIIFVSLLSRKQTKFERFLKITIYGRTVDARINIEKKYPDLTIPLIIVNEIGAIWTNIQSTRKQLIKEASE